MRCLFPKVLSGMARCSRTKTYAPLCGHLINYMDGMEDILQGGRDEMRGFGGRAGFTTFARIFSASFLFVSLCLLVLFLGWCCLLGFVCFVFFKPVKDFCK